MKLKSFLITGVVALSCSALGLRAQTAEKSRVLVNVYQPKSAPAYVSEYTHGGNDSLRSVVINNDADSELTSIKFGWVADTPKSCALQSKLPPLFGELSDHAVHIASRKAALVSDFGLNIKELTDEAAKQSRLMMLVEVVPIRETFADGRVWTGDLPSFKPYDSAAVEAASLNCTDHHLIPSAEILAALGLAADCVPAREQVDVDPAVKQAVLQSRYMSSQRPASTSDPCVLDEDCGLKNAKQGLPRQDAAFLQLKSLQANTLQPNSTDPNPPVQPGGWACTSSSDATIFCQVDYKNGTCTMGYCSAAKGCPKQQCSSTP